jgi:TolA-binding protein
MFVRTGRRSVVAVCALVAWFAAGRSIPPAAAQDAAASRAAEQQFVAAAGLHNLKDFKLAAVEWQKFLTDFPNDKRASEARYYMAICRLQTGDNEGAVASFEKLLKETPDFKEAVSARLYLGLAQNNAARQSQNGAGKKEMFAAAEKTLGELLKIAPEGKHVAQAVYYRAEALYALDKKQEAADLYKRVVNDFDDDPLVPDALYAYGVTVDELGKAQQAATVYAEFIKYYPKHALAVDVNVRRAEILLNSGDFNGAEGLFAAAAAAPGYDAADYALLRQADSRYGQKQFAQAMALYDELPKRFPRSTYRANAALAAGKSAYNAQDYAAAVDRLAASAAGQGESAAEAAHWSAKSLIKLKRAPEALALVDDVLKRAGNTKFAAALALDRADALYDIPNRRADALAAYKAVVDAFPGDAIAPQASYLAAFTALELGRNPEAAALAEAFLKAHAGHELRVDVGYVKAEALLRDAKYDAAAAAYDDLIGAGRNHADRNQWLVRRALALSLAGKHDEVIQALGKEIDSLGKPALQAEAAHLLGLSRQTKKDYARAIADFQAALQYDPGRASADETMLALAETQRLAGDAKSSRATLARFTQTYPQSKLGGTAAYRAAELAYDANDLTAAAASYRRVIEGPDGELTPHARYGLAWSLLGNNDPSGAAAALDDLLKGKVPSELAPKARYARALARRQLNQYEPALQDIAEFLKSNPKGNDLADALFVQGLCEEGLKRNDAAAATFTKLLQGAPKYAGAPKVLYELGWIHKSAGRTKESTDAFARLAAEHAKSELVAEALFHVGEDAYARKDYAKAVDAYYDAREKADTPELAEKSAHKLGWSYYHAGDFANAETWFKYQQQHYGKGSLAADAAFMQAESEFKLASAATDPKAKQKKYQEALATYRRIGTPQNADFAVLALLHAGQSAAQLEDWQGALTSLDAAAKQFPQTPYLPEITYEQAWARQNLSREDEALKLYESVTEQTDREVAARARYMIGEIYFNRKNHAEAVRHFIRAALVYAYPEWQARSHFEAGRCFEVLGKLDQARQSYQEVVSKYGKYEEAELAKKRLAELGQ